MIFTYQLSALCSEHWAAPGFLMDEKKDVWFRDKICGFVKKKVINAQNYSGLATTWGGYLQHLRLVDEDLS